MSAISFDSSTTQWAMPSSGNMIAAFGGNVIAAHTNVASAGPLDDLPDGSPDGDTLSATGFTLGVDLDVATSSDDNSIWNGGPVTFANISNASNWTFQNTLPSGAHTSGDVLGTGSVTYATQQSDTPCFAPGTMIATEAGEAAVETLKIGDMVRTATGDLVPVIWIGRHTAVKTFARERMEPVRFAAGSLGGGLPHSDLIVTQDHGMVIDGLVINAAALVNGSDIDLIALDDLPERVVYYHVETEAHDVILANGVSLETYVDIPSRKVFDNYAKYLALYGEEHRVTEMMTKRITSQRLLPNALRARLGIDGTLDMHLLATG